MNPISILVTLIVVGVVLYLVSIIPMVAWIKTVINALAAVLVLLWLLQVFGIYNSGINGRLFPLNHSANTR